MKDLNNTPDFYYTQYCLQEKKRAEKAALVKTLAAIIILILSTYAAGYIAGLIFDTVYTVFGIEYGEVYLLDRIGDAFIYTCDLLIPGCLFVLIRRIDFRQCFGFCIDSSERERVTPLTVLRYSAIAFSVSCVMSFLSSYFTYYTGLDSSVFSYPVASNAIELVFDIISMALLPALFEEFFFRGILLAELAPYGRSFAIVTSAFFFASVHGSIEQMAYSFVYGLLFAYIAVKTGSLLTGVLMHFLNNAYSCVLDYLSYEIPPAIFDTAAGALQIIIVFAGLLSAVYLIGTGRFAVNEEQDKHPLPGRLSISETFSVYTTPLMAAYSVLVLLETLFAYFVRM